MEWMLMPLRRYADFSGRSRRKEYWMFALFCALVYLAFMILMVALGAGAFMGAMGGSAAGMGAMGGGALVVGGLFMIFALAILIPGIAVGVRRLHDTNRTGWWILAPLAGYPLQIVGAAMQSGAVAILGTLVTLVLGIVVLVFYCLDGTPGPNRYGDDPKLRGTDAAAAY